jgi:uncharacterized lipoprotein YajG
MKRLLRGLAILSVASLLLAGCATKSDSSRQSKGTSATPPPGEVYTPPVAAPQSNP